MGAVTGVRLVDVQASCLILRASAFAYYCACLNLRIVHKSMLNYAHLKIMNLATFFISEILHMPMMNKIIPTLTPAFENEHVNIPLLSVPNSAHDIFDSIAGNLSIC